MKSYHRIFILFLLREVRSFALNMCTTLIGPHWLKFDVIQEQTDLAKPICFSDCNITVLQGTPDNKYNVEELIDSGKCFSLDFL